MYNEKNEVLSLNLFCSTAKAIYLAPMSIESSHAKWLARYNGSIKSITVFYKTTESWRRLFSLTCTKFLPMANSTQVSISILFANVSNPFWPGAVIGK